MPVKYSKLSRVVRFEHINLSGKEITSQSKTNSELEIDVINPANTPVDESGTIVICKELASVIKQTLLDKHEFDDYLVLLVNQKTNGNEVTGDWKGHKFKSEDL
jgi:hypothetical protein